MKNIPNDIFERLKKLSFYSYCPYSNLQVAAMVVVKNNKLYSGVNIENAAFGDTICAEQTVLSQVYTQGLQKNDIESIHIFAPIELLPTPCGSCRQIMSELLNPETLVYLYNKNGCQLQKKVSELLPYPFSFTISSN